LLSPARRAPETIGNFDIAAGVDTCFSATVANVAPEHANAAAHTTAHPSKTR
jgi:hypothetical protein